MDWAGALRCGEARPSGSNTPLLLDETATAWQVTSGSMDVFAVPVRDGRIDGPREFLFRVEAGTVLPGFGYDSRGRTTLVAVGGTDTMVAPVRAEDLHAYVATSPEAGAALVEATVVGMAGAFAEAIRHTGRVDVLLDDLGVADDVMVPAGCSAGTWRDVRWGQVMARGLYLLDVDFTTLGERDAPFPLAPGAWLTADEEGGSVPLRVWRTADLIADGRIWPALSAFHRFALEWAARHRVAEERLRIAQMRARIASDQETREAAVSGMADVMLANGGARRERLTHRSIRPLHAALELIGEALGIHFRDDAAMSGGGEGADDPLVTARRMAEASSVGCRRVLLDTSWWVRDAGPLLGVLEIRHLAVTGAAADGGAGERSPVALLPVPGPGYEMVEPETGHRTPVTAALARHLAPFGMQFYRALPVTPVRLADLWRFVAHGAGPDVRVLLFVAVLGTLLGLVLPLLTGYLFDDVIPSAERGGLVAVGIALVVTSVAGVLFEITRTLTSTRLHTRVSTALQMAVLDRLVRLPATFFRGYRAGDLGQRALGIQTIGAALGGSTLSAILASATGLGALVLLMSYSLPLTLVSLGVLSVNVAVSAVALRRSLDASRRLQATSGDLSSLMMELLRGMPKLRVAAAEARAFSRWSDAFREQTRVTFSVGVYGLNLDVFTTVLEIASTAALFSVYAWIAADAAAGLSTGQFLAFASAQGMFVGAGLALSETAMDVVRLLPTWERVQPLLSATPETSAYRPDPGPLTGHIEVSQLRFGYSSDGPLILDGISLTIRPNMFVALVGPSGSGKSTLLRLLLGFERPLSGSVRYDGQDLTSIDVAAVRRQIGVVLQSATLSAGDIHSNIVGAGNHSLQEAWDAARMAGMEDDLRAMPMGLHTLISEGGGTLSGGQRQRLLIARALVGRPRLLFFDEATSALDNHTQRIVSESVERLHATRVVVAHRLSTIRHADLIVVLDGGRIVEQGNHDTLMAVNGLYASLAARQGH